MPKYQMILAPGYMIALIFSREKIFWVIARHFTGWHHYFENGQPAKLNNASHRVNDAIISDCDFAGRAAAHFSAAARHRCKKPPSPVGRATPSHFIPD